MFGRKKETPLDKRIKELRKEMEKLDSELKSLKMTSSFSSAVSDKTEGAKITHFETPIKEKISFVPSVSNPNVQTNVQVDTSVIASQTSVVQDKRSSMSVSSNTTDLFNYAERKRSLFASDSQFDSEEERHKREKFAHYFMAGHFQNLKPLRQERRIMRNKLIMVLIAIALLVAWLIYYFYYIT